MINEYVDHLDHLDHLRETKDLFGTTPSAGSPNLKKDLKISNFKSG
jgi:hypothetical protein